MDDRKWEILLHACAEVLSVQPIGWSREPLEGGSWCCWTTFDRLGAGYWNGPLPTKAEIFDTYLGHGKNWSQYFDYHQLCHLIIPRTFFWERASPGNYVNGTVMQDVEALSKRLTDLDIPHRLAPLVLEIKLY